MSEQALAELRERLAEQSGMRLRPSDLIRLLREAELPSRPALEIAVEEMFGQTSTLPKDGRAGVALLIDFHMRQMAELAKLL